MTLQGLWKLSSHQHSESQENSPDTAVQWRSLKGLSMTFLHAASTPFQQKASVCGDDPQNLLGAGSLPDYTATLHRHDNQKPTMCTLNVVQSCNRPSPVCTEVVTKTSAPPASRSPRQIGSKGSQGSARYTNEERGVPISSRVANGLR